MKAKVQHRFLAVLATSTLATPAFAANDVVAYMTARLAAGGWLPALITAGFVMLALIEVFKRWQSIFEGSDIFKNISVIASLIALSVWWGDVVSFLLTLTK